MQMRALAHRWAGKMAPSGSSSAQPADMSAPCQRICTFFLLLVCETREATKAARCGARGRSGWPQSGATSTQQHGQRGRSHSAANRPKLPPPLSFALRTWLTAPVTMLSVPPPLEVCVTKAVAGEMAQLSLRSARRGHTSAAARGLLAPACCPPKALR